MAKGLDSRIRSRRWCLAIVAIAGCNEGSLPSGRPDRGLPPVAESDSGTLAADPDGPKPPGSGMDAFTDAGTGADVDAGAIAPLPTDAGVAMDAGPPPEPPWMPPAPHANQPTFEIVLVDNRERDFTQRGWMERDSAFRRNAEYAASIWARYFVSPHTVIVQVVADRSSERGSGGFTNARRVGSVGGYPVYEPGALSKLKTGEDPGAVWFDGADIRVSVNPNYDRFWIDPSPGNNTPIPAGKTDYVFFFLHEIGHGLGFGSARSISPDSYGELPGYMTKYDSLTEFVGGGPALVDGQPNQMLFVGPHARSVFGRPVPLASYRFGHNLGNNLSHLGSFSLERDSPDYYRDRCRQPNPLTDSLMTSCQLLQGGERRRIQPIDIAILKDLGYPIHSP